MSDQILLATAMTYLPALVRLTALAMTLPLIAGSAVPVRVRFALPVTRESRRTRGYHGNPDYKESENE